MAKENGWEWLVPAGIGVVIGILLSQTGALPQLQLGASAQPQGMAGMGEWWGTGNCSCVVACPCPPGGGVRPRVVQTQM